MKSNNISKLAKKNKVFSKFFLEYVNYIQKVSRILNQKDIDKFLSSLDNARKKQSTIFVAGNGGSAANAMTMANDLGFDIFKKTKTKKPFKIVSLTDNSSVVTAISNDISYDEIFISQLKIHFKKGDYLLLFSASGNSNNLVKAAQWVKKNKGVCLGLLGFDGGKLKKICNTSVVFKTLKGEYGPVEDFHLIMNHTLAHWFQAKLNR